MTSHLCIPRCTGASSRATCAARRESERGREARSYGLTKPGWAQLDKELEHWQRLSPAVVLVTNAAQEVRDEDRALVGRLRMRFRALAKRRWANTELDKELRFHIERQTEENIAAGMSAREAREAASRMFGE